MATVLGKTNRPTDAPTAGDGRTPPPQPLVLLAEDHEDTRFLLRYLLESRGCRVAEAADGEEAVRLAETMRPDIVVMDVSLPRLDGLAATRRIRERAALRGTPIVFLSGHAQPDFRAAALATGGDEYFVKPLSLDELGLAVERHLRKGGPSKPGDSPKGFES